MSAVSNTIFNNYLTAYGAPKLSKYDTHKKSELRGTYNSIVKANKDAPWFLPINDQDTKFGAIGLKESARNLRSSLAEVGGLEEDGSFNKKHASSTDPDITSIMSSKDLYAIGASSRVSSLTDVVKIPSIAFLYSSMESSLKTDPQHFPKITIPSMLTSEI